MSSCLIVVAAGVAVISLRWPLRTALFPLVISSCVLILALVELLMSLFIEQKVSVKGPRVDFTFSEDVDKKIALRRTLMAFGWITGFFILIVLFGFSIAVALFVFLYVKFQGREKWAVSIIMAFSSWFFFWGLFVRLLHTPLIEGWVFKELRAIGIG